MTASSPPRPALSFQAFHGPTAHARGPSVATLIDETELAASGASIATAVQRLQQLWPSWLTEVPSLDDVSAAQGLALLAAHWARGLLNDRRGLVLDAGAMRPRPRKLLVWVGFHEPRLAAQALALGLRVVELAQHGPWPPEPAVHQQIEKLLQSCRSQHPDYLARILMLGANARGVPVTHSPYGGRSRQYGWGTRSQLFVEASPLHESAAGREVGKNKVLTNQVLSSMGFPVTRQRVVASDAEARVAAAELGWPVVVKPADSGRGRGVHTGIRDAAHLLRAMADARSFTQLPLVIEAQEQGVDHRLLVLRGRLVAATARHPPAVRGDGHSTVAQLVAALNAQRAGDAVSARYLKLIERDPVIEQHLAALALHWDSVLAEGRSVTLRGNANVSTGGTPVNVMQRMHPQVRVLAEAVAAVVGLDAVGIDYLCTDIALAPEAAGAVVLEVNTLPGLDLHIADGSFSEPELGRLVLGERPAPVPVVVVIDNDRGALLALARRLAQTADASPWPSGLGDDPRVGGLGVVSADMATLDGLPLKLPVDTVGARASRMLSHPRCAALVVLADTTEVAEQGFVVERCSLTMWNSGNHGPTQVAAREAALRCSDQWLCLAPAQGWLDEAAMACLGSVLRQSLSNTGAASPSMPAYPAGAPWLRMPPRDAGLRALRRHAQQPGPSLVSQMRDERWLLPHFLSHYRSLGVRNFHVLDDGSSDGTRELLLAQEDVSVWTSPVAFNERLANGERFHHHVVALLVRHAAAAANDRATPLGDWVLAVDADEFMVLPERFAGLEGADGLLAHLERQGQRCVLASMVDFYPRRLRDSAGADPGLSPWALCPWFDRGRVFELLHEPGNAAPRPRKTGAGVRWRLQRLLQQRQPALHEQIYGGQGYDTPALWKTPVVKSGPGLYWPDSHSTPLAPARDVELALMHFKFGPDAVQKVRTAVHEGRHYLGSIEYRFLSAALEHLADEDLLCGSSVLFEGAASLQAAGHIV